MEFSFLSKYLKEKVGDRVKNKQCNRLQEKQNVNEGGFWNYDKFIW